MKYVTLKSERIKYWLSVGAQPSDRVQWLLSKYNILPPVPIPDHTKVHLIKKEVKEAAKAALAAAKDAKAPPKTPAK